MSKNLYIILITLILSTTTFTWSSEITILARKAVVIRNCDVYENLSLSPSDTPLCSIKAGELVDVIMTKQMNRDTCKIKSSSGCIGYIPIQYVPRLSQEKLERIMEIDSLNSNKADSIRRMKLLDDINLRLKRKTQDSILNSEDIL